MKSTKGVRRQQKYEQKAIHDVRLIKEEIAKWSRETNGSLAIIKENQAEINHLKKQIMVQEKEIQSKKDTLSFTNSQMDFKDNEIFESFQEKQNEI